MTSLSKLLGLGASDVVTTPLRSQEVIRRLLTLHSSANEVKDSPVADLRAALGLEHIIGELVCVAADSFEHCLTGRGRIEFRYPVVNHGEEQLRGKIESKTTVSTFLAGFTATALIELLLKGAPFSMSAGIAAVSLTGSLALFVAAVYMYDPLSMPEGFWVDEDRPTFRWRGKTFEKHFRANGPLYALMVWTWKYVFTPAVALGLLGFVMMLVSTGNSVILCGALLVLIGAGIWYLWFRPRLGTD